jgi:hypothetical protein
VTTTDPRLAGGGSFTPHVYSRVYYVDPVNGADTAGPTRGCYEVPYKTLQALCTAIGPPVSAADFEAPILINIIGTAQVDAPAVVVNLPRTRRLTIMAPGCSLPRLNLEIKKEDRFGSLEHASLSLMGSGIGNPTVLSPVTKPPPDALVIGDGTDAIVLKSSYTTPPPLQFVDPQANVIDLKLMGCDIRGSIRQDPTTSYWKFPTSPTDRNFSVLSFANCRMYAPGGGVDVTANFFLGPPPTSPFPALPYVMFGVVAIGTFFESTSPVQGIRALAFGRMSICEWRCPIRVYDGLLDSEGAGVFETGVRPGASWQGPAGSLRIDASSNYYFVANGATLVAPATKTILNNLT